MDIRDLVTNPEKCDELLSELDEAAKAVGYFGLPISEVAHKSVLREVIYRWAAKAKPESAKKEKRATQLPDDFCLDRNGIVFALDLGIQASDEFDKFRDYHKAKGSTMKDWNAAWRTWARNAAKFAKKPAIGRQSVVDNYAAQAAAARGEHGKPANREFAGECSVVQPHAT